MDERRRKMRGMRIILPLAVIFLLTGVMGVYGEEFDETINLAGTEVNLHFYGNPKSGTVYFLPHNNELIAKEATRSHIDKNGGIMMEIRGQDDELRKEIAIKNKASYGRKRYIFFKAGDIVCAIDPNRIYTDAGIKSALDEYFKNEGKNKPDRKKMGEIYNEVRNFRDLVIAGIRKQNPSAVIAVHNNTPGRYGINSYEKGTGLYKDVVDESKEYDPNPYIGDPSNKDNFFYVTEGRDFLNLRARQYNVILQDNNKIKPGMKGDDGSFSVYCQQNGIRYINIEVQDGSKEGVGKSKNPDIQKKMMQAVQNIL